MAESRRGGKRGIRGPAIGPSWFALMAVLTCALLAGCAQEALKQDLQAGFVTVSLCPDGSGRHGREGCGDRFVIGRDGHVNALVEFAGVEAGTHSVHLVWIAPDGHEIFRKYGEVALRGDEDGYTAEISWRKAEDFGYLRREVQKRQRPGFALDSRLNIEPDRERSPGQYCLRVYWNRELLNEQVFHLEEITHQV
jgi:hypothetical protein